MTQQKENKSLTQASEWRRPRQEGYVITLPSGFKARLRPVALDMLILSGKLPDLLTPIAAKSLWTETDTAAIGDQAELAKGFAELINIVVPAAMMYPLVVDDPQAENEIGLEDIDFSDKTAIFQLVTQPAEVLRRFCDQQTAGVESLLYSKNDMPAAQ